MLGEEKRIQVGEGTGAEDRDHFGLIKYKRLRLIERYGK